MRLLIRKNLLLILCVFLLILSACSQNEADITTESREKIQAQEKNAFKIYLVEEDIATTKLINLAINKYNESNPEVQFDKVIVKTVDEYTTRVSTELMAGEGPDILLFNSYSDIAFRKIMEMGALVSLNEFIEEDKEFNIEDYKKVIMDSGLYKGKRYLIPLYYSVGAFLTTDDLLSKNGIHIDLEHWTLNDFAEQTNKLNKNSVDSEKAYFISYNDYKFYNCLYGSGEKFIDYEKRSVKLNTSEFVEHLNNCKTIYETAQISYEISLKYNHKYIDMMKDNQLIAKDYTSICIPQLHSIANNIKYNLNSEPRLYPIPTGNESLKYTAAPTYLVAINNNCSDKQLAYFFIKSLLSEDLQVQTTESNPMLPVNKKAYEKQLNEYSTEGGAERFFKSKDGTQIPIEPLSPLMVKDLQTIVNNITTCEITDNVVSHLIWKEYSNFIDGNCTAEEAARNMENKVQLYLNE